MPKLWEIPIIKQARARLLRIEAKTAIPTVSKILQIQRRQMDVPFMVRAPKGLEYFQTQVPKKLQRPYASNNNKRLTFLQTSSGRPTAKATCQSFWALTSALKMHLPKCFLRSL